jgi:hypothetical protein
MRILAVFLIAFASGALADESDPDGTVALEIEAGKTAPVTATPGSSILCDQPSVVAPEFSPDGNGLVLRAHKAGSTLCGVWLAGKPGGLYRVRVIAAPTRDAGHDGSGVALDAGSPAGARPDRLRL